MHADIHGFYRRRSDLFTIYQCAVQSCVRCSFYKTYSDRG